MWKSLISILTGGGMKSVESIASEWIETEMESAEAKAVMVKTLDPNGLMRRHLSKEVTKMYKIYIFTLLFLLSVEFFCAFFGVKVNTNALAIATSKATELFVPITTLFGVIVSASFGVNYANVKRNK